MLDNFGQELLLAPAYSSKGLLGIGGEYPLRNKNSAMRPSSFVNYATVSPGCRDFVTSLRGLSLPLLHP